MESTKFNSLLHGVYKHAIDASLSGLMFIDLAGNIQYINQVAESLLKPLLPYNRFKAAGYHLSDKCVIGPWHRIEELIPVKFWNVFTDDFFGFSMMQALRMGLVSKTVHRTIHKKELKVRTTFIFEGEKENHGLLLLIDDVTTLKAISEQNQVRMQKETLGEMLQQISLEMKDHLSAVRGWGSLLRRDLDCEPNLKEMANLIVNTTRALEEKIAQIILFGKTEELDCETCEMNQFIRKMIASFKNDAAFGDNYQWQIHLPENSLFAPIDSEKLLLALKHLVSHSIHAMKEGGVISLSLLKRDFYFEITISDTSGGLEEEMQNLLFSPLLPEKNGVRSLLMARKIIEAHFGTLQVRSHLTKGTTFTITLPIHRF